MNEKQKVNEDEDKKSSSSFYLFHPCLSFCWIDIEIWSRWKGLAKTIMTIPKFKRAWEKTKDVHAKEFKDFIASL